MAETVMAKYAWVSQNGEDLFNVTVNDQIMHPPEFPGYRSANLTNYKARTLAEAVHLARKKGFIPWTHDTTRTWNYTYY